MRRAASEGQHLVMPRLREVEHAMKTSEAERAVETRDPALEPLIDKPILTIHALSLFYGSAHALVDISMEIPEKQVTAFIGPSGCGKSTLLRCFNRLNDLVDEVRVRGDIRYHGASIFA